MTLSRRSLLRGGAVLVASGYLAPAFVTQTARALEPATAAAPSPNPRILVVLQLSGGNDGLNTLVPFADPGYSQLRPSLGVAGGDVLRLNDSVGLHPGLSAFKSLFDQGKLAVVQGVGYPNPNRSHFRSMDIWHTADPDTFERSGWLGRYVDACQCNQSNALSAISVGDQLNGLFWTDTTLVPAISSLGAFSFVTDTKYKNDRTYQLQALQNIYNQAGTFSPFESLIRQGTLDALAGSDELQQVAASYQSPVDYPKNNGLANQLKLVAQVIAGNVGTRLFSVSMGGFDTHANQKDHHANLLSQLGQAVAAFVQDLASMQRQDDVVLMTFSEFGRRARQNASDGTDHGTAEPMFVIGNAVQGGVYGTYPSLENLDANGDLQFTTDFRSVYGGILRDQLGADPAAVLGADFAPLSVLHA